MGLNRVAASGSNAFGQLGDSTTTDKTSPIATLNASTFRQVSAGPTHSLAVDFGGNVWAWGQNNYGQLGDGTTSNKSAPVQVPGLSGVVAVAAGGAVDGYGSFPSHVGFSLALKSDGTVWAWGYNGLGQLGDGSTTNRLSPVQVSGLVGVVAIAAGTAHGLAVKSDGTVWAWGRNDNGELGDGTTTTRTTPIAMSGISGAVEVAGARVKWDELPDNDTRGYLAHSLIRKNDGTVWATGYNGFGQLGDGTTSSRTSPVQMLNIASAVAIAAGSLHSVVASSDGTVKACGYNNTGQVGDGTTTSRAAPVNVATLSNVIAVSAGGTQVNKFDAVGYSCAVSGNGNVYAWGWNGAGNLGDGTTTTRLTPVQWGLGTGTFNRVSAGGAYTLALNDKQTLLFATAAGWPIEQKDFGSIIAGNTLGPSPVDLYNGSSTSVEIVNLTLTSVPSGDVIELSKTSDPFIPEDSLAFAGTFAPASLIGSVYVRFRPPITSPGGQKSFRLRARGTPV